MMEFHNYILSDSSYKVRLLLEMLRVEFTSVKVNFHPGRENLGADFLGLNPLATLPVLRDNNLVLRGATAILVYVALKHDPDRQWCPSDPATMGRIMMWLDFAEHELRPISMARFTNLCGSDDPIAADVAAGEAALDILEDHIATAELVGQRWVAARHATIADLALFPAVAMAPECGISLDSRPATWRWIDRVKRLPNFSVMPGVLPLLEPQAA